MLAEDRRFPWAASHGNYTHVINEDEKRVLDAMGRKKRNGSEGTLSKPSFISKEMVARARNFPFAPTIRFETSIGRRCVASQIRSENGRFWTIVGRKFVQLDGSLGTLTSSERKADSVLVCPFGLLVGWSAFSDVVASKCGYDRNSVGGNLEPDVARALGVLSYGSPFRPRTTLNVSAKTPVILCSGEKHEQSQNQHPFTQPSGMEPTCTVSDRL